MGEKSVQEEFLGEESMGENIWLKSICKKSFWVKSLWVRDALLTLTSQIANLKRSLPNPNKVDFANHKKILDPYIFTNLNIVYFTNHNIVHFTNL